MLKRLREKVSGKGATDKLLANVQQGVDPTTIWRMGDQIGEGGVGTVYKVTHTMSGMIAAAKVIDVTNKSDLEEFVIEVDALVMVQHPGVVKLHAAYYHADKLWMIIDFCSGGAFDDIYLERDEGLSEPELRCIACQLAKALQHIHAQGLFHRDVKGGNLLLEQNGSVKLTDFGSCSLNNIPGRKRDTFVGSPYWMAPEVIACETANRKNAYDERADIWSFGITLIELADTNPPYQELHPMRALLKIVKAEPPSLEDPHKWSEDFYEFLDLCLKKEPDERPTLATLLNHPFIRNKDTPADRQHLVRLACGEAPPASPEDGDSLGAASAPSALDSRRTSSASTYGGFGMSMEDIQAEGNTGGTSNESYDEDDDDEFGDDNDEWGF